MEELLLLVIGVSAIAISPLVPVLRPVAKVAVKGGLAVEGAATAAAAAAGHQLDKMRSKSKANGAVIDGQVAPAEAVEAEVPEGVAEAPEAMTAPAEAPAMETASAAEAVAEPAEAAATPLEETAPSKVVGPGIIDVDGIGPRVAEVLADAGITTLEQLEATDEARLREILTAAGPRFRSMDPGSWPQQARQLLGKDS